MADDNTQPATDPIAQAAKKFNISQEVLDKHPKLIQLIVETESMTDAERTYWFQILPIMTEEQVEKLRGILIKEKEQLAKLDSEYEKELKRINDKHILEWKEQETRKKREERQKAENAVEAEESKAEEDILSKLNEV